MAKLTPHLWFDHRALEAAELYTSIFPGAKKLASATLHDTPSDSVDIAEIELFGLSFQLINAGPLFKPTPAISFMVNCESEEQVDSLWAGLIEGGRILMPLGDYPFCSHFGWVADRWGFNWQLRLEPKLAPSIVPSLMFVGDNLGRAEEALSLYSTLLSPSKVEFVERYSELESSPHAGLIKHAQFSYQGQRVALMDSPGPHAFGFNEAVSLMLHCRDQEEIDRLWESLSAVPEAEQCGWLKDSFGVSWQIVPEALDRMLSEGDEQAISRVTKAFLKMKKFDLATLENAYGGS